MRKPVIIGNFLLLLRSVSSNLQWIAGYDPLTYIDDHAAIDLDQKEIEMYLVADVFQQAGRIYSKGAHSQSIAQLRLLNPATPASPFPVGTLVYGTGVDGSGVQGRLVEEAMWSEQTEEVVLFVEYDREKSVESSSHCQVGALATTKSADDHGCFVATGEVQVLHYARNTRAYTFNYEYNVSKDNVNWRTIRGFSTGAFEEMWNCTNCPYDTFNKFSSYYGMPDYGDRIVQAALDGTGTDFENGNLDFSKETRKGRAEAIKIATKFLNIWMYVIRMMEHALDQCELPCEKKGNVMYAPAQKAQCDDSPVRAWDQAVAFYAGSLEGESGLGEGILFFDLADTMCARFLACGDDAELRFGISYVNNVVINQFIKGQVHVLKRECEMARNSKDLIIKLMAIPLIQATLYNTFEQIYAQFDDEEEEAKKAVEGSLYAATVLPLVHDCNPEDAQLIYESLLFERDDTNSSQILNFVAVKQAFERNYECLGITCRSVGGIWGGREYSPFALPCQDEIDTEKTIHIGLVVAAAGGTLVVCVLMYLSYQRFKTKGIDRNYQQQAPSTIPDDVFQAARPMD